MNKTIGIVFFGLMFLMSTFMLYPETSGIDLTDQGTERLGSFSVDTDWETEGTLTNLQTDGDLIYPLASETGSWESFTIQGEEIDLIQIETVSDIREGNINASILLYENSSTSNEPDKILYNVVDQPEYDFQFEGIADRYDYFKVNLEITEQGGNSNERPNVDSINVDYSENLDRKGLGFKNSIFQIFVLFAFIGFCLIGFIKEVTS